MPAINRDLLLTVLASRQEPLANSAVEQLQVICAWPVSGQYGTGSRVLYYVLVAACVFARKVDWLRNTCLAGALLLPVVAALHGIVLAVVHTDNATDLDMYGALQLCAIGALAAPVTVKISRTYYNDPGRNTIFAWSCIVLAGLLSLTVEFYRSASTSCARDDFGNPVSTNPSLFPYGNASCGLTCTETFPTSPIRGGSANNIYIIPAPTKLTFNVATLLAAACCIPAILLCAWMWIKILKENSKHQERQERQDTDPLDRLTSPPDNLEESAAICPRDSNAGEDTPDERNGLPIGTEILVVFFAAAVFSVLVAGERNLFSKQLSYQTEPLPNIGQWQPIVGTGVVIIGSLYLILAQAMQQERNSLKEDQCPSVRLIHSFPNETDIYLGELDDGDRAVIVLNHLDQDQHLDVDFAKLLAIESAAVEELWTGRKVPTVSSYRASIGPHCSLSLRLSNVTVTKPPSRNPSRIAVSTKPEHERSPTEHRISGWRCSFGLPRTKLEILRPLARIMVRISDYVSKPRQGRFGNDALSTGKAAKYPTIPGEHYVNPRLRETISIYGDGRESTPSQTSRLSGLSLRPCSSTPGPTVSEQASSTEGQTVTIRRRKDTLASEAGTLRRGETLDVPSPSSPVRSPTRTIQPISDEVVAVPGNPITITISSESDRS